jgi:hypothetical protein
MPATWTFPQLFLILLVGFAPLSLAFSRSNPMSEAFVPILAAHYLVINSMCWNAFMQTTTWQRGEDLFRFTLSPFLPAASFYFGVLAILAVLSAWISVLIGVHRFARRQVWSFSASCITFLIGLVVSMWTPVGFQAWIDSIPTPN